MSHAMTRPTETANNWTVRLVLHAGDGPPDKEQQVYAMTYMDAAEAAEHFACVLHDREQCDQNMTDSDFDGCSSVIEVKTKTGWKRFHVQCRVRREYEAISQ